MASTMPPPPPPQQPDNSGAAVPDSYFTESRKGEVNELRNLLRNFATERDQQRKRDIIKKVIAYMTLGIDVSRLFTEMMLAIETRDLVIKKMVYLFLCNYATSHPELAQMCTNTLVKDCGNDDPMVRGLALRSLCSLRLPQMVEYISEPLRRSLTDGHAYVRKTGVMGILKLHHLDADALEQSQMVDILYDMLRDPDAQVVSNCILVLNEIMQSSGGMAINRAIMMHLLNRIHEFSEFGVIVVIELIPRYIPANDDEAYAIMTLLDPVLKTSNAGAVLAVIQAFLSLSHHLEEDMTRHVLTRIKAPFVTLLSAGSSEVGHVHLQNAHALVDLSPGIFDDEYRQFYIKEGHDPTHVQYLKVSLLPKLANPSNAPDIVSELAENVYNTTPKLSRLAVRAMTRIACRNVGGSGCEQSVALRLVEWLDSTVDHVCSEAATALVNLVRCHPQLKEIIAPPLPRALKYVQEPSGRASLIYLLGECGTDEAPYALEKVIDAYEKEDSSAVRMALLTATTRLFFQRPPEVQNMLGRLLAKVTDDVSNQDLHDRGLFYYRLLTSGQESIVSAAVKTAPSSSDLFAEENDAALRKELMKEFNTLSILYGKSSENFIGSKYQIPYVQLPKEHPLPPGAEDVVVPPPNPAPVAPVVEGPAAPADGGVVDLLGFGGDAAPAPAAAPVAPPSTSLSLRSAMTMSGDEYQAAWEAIPDADATVTAIPLSSMPTLQWMEQTLTSVHIFTMASGEVENELKFYHYCCDESDTFYLIQSNISKDQDPLLIVTCKSQGAQKEALMEYIKNSLT
mmetsp:Transcript_16779/g.25356  ORF Transcript_16779/g.25356 Transcript_16779/m.25356 type:complete len:794 (-) Transcript_16779:8-2389(-)